MSELNIKVVLLVNLQTYIIWLISHLGWLALMFSAAFAAGNLFLRKYRFVSAIERLVFTVALGMGLCALLLFVFGLLGLLYRPVIIALTITGASASLFGLMRNRHNRRAFLHWIRTEIQKPRGLLTLGLLTVSLVYAALLLLSTLYPPIHWDAIASHLVLSRQYLIQHEIIVWHGAAHPILPALNHMLFTWAFALQDDILAQLVEHCFLMLTALGLFAMGQRMGKPVVGFASAGLWLAHPLVLWLGESGYVDVAAACVAFLGIYALRVFWDDRDSKWWLLALALFGMAAGIKMSALFFPVAAGLIGIWAYARSRISLPDLVKGICIALAISVPWYVFIAYQTCNPFWPMFPQLSCGEWSNPGFFNDLVSGGGLPKTFLNFFLLPYYISFRPELFFSDNGQALFWFIIFWPLAGIVSFWQSSIRWWVMWILAYSAYWFSFASFLRYWLPVVPIVGLAIYESLDWALEKFSVSSKLRNAVLLILALVAIGDGAVTVRTYLSSKGRLLPITEEDRRKWLTRLCAGYGGVDYINRHAKPDDKAYVISGAYLTYFLQPQVVGLLPIELYQDQATSTLIWPKNTSWLQQLEKHKVDWILIHHKGLNLPEASPFDNEPGSTYKKVYESEEAYVFHRTPIPADLSEDAARLKSSDPCSSYSDLEANSAPTYSGVHETADCEVVEGWAWNASKPDCPVNVNIYDADRLLITIPANRLRDKLVDAGMGNGKHGFSYQVPLRFRDGRPHSIRVTIAETGETLESSPKTINCQRIPGLKLEN